MVDVANRMGNRAGTSKEMTSGAGGRIADIGWSGWKHIISRTRRRLKKHDATITSAGVAYYATLALIPGITALIIGYVLLTDGAQITAWLNSSNAVVPDQVAELLREQVDKILNSQGPGLWVALCLALGFSLFSARNGITTLIHGLNRAAGVDENRDGISFVIRTLLFAIGASIFVLLMLALTVGGSEIISALGLSETLETVALAGRWVVVIFLVMAAISILYHFGPNIRRRDLDIITVGSLFATFLWVTSSLIFAWYVQTAGTYDRIYGTLGSIIILMIWLYISAYAILAGAEVRLKN